MKKKKWQARRSSGRQDKDLKSRGGEVTKLLLFTRVPSKSELPSIHSESAAGKEKPKIALSYKMH